MRGHTQRRPRTVSGIMGVIIAVCRICIHSMALVSQTITDLSFNMHVEDLLHREVRVFKMVTEDLPGREVLKNCIAQCIQRNFSTFYSLTYWLHEIFDIGILLPIY